MVEEAGLAAPAQHHLRHQKGLQEAVVRDKPLIRAIDPAGDLVVEVDPCLQGR